MPYCGKCVHNCWRCDRWHERVCDACDFEPACADHNCWSMAELEEGKHA